MKILYLSILVLGLLISGCCCVTPPSGSTPVSGGVSQTQSRNYWSGTAPFAVTGWGYSGTSLQLTMQNMDGQEVVLNDISIAGSTVFSTATTFNVGETKTIAINMGSSCGTSGSSFELSSIEFTYSKGIVTGLIQKGAKPIVGKCS